MRFFTTKTKVKNKFFKLIIQRMSFDFVFIKKILCADVQISIFKKMILIFELKQQKKNWIERNLYCNGALSGAYGVIFYPNWLNITRVLLYDTAHFSLKILLFCFLLEKKVYKMTTTLDFNIFGFKIFFYTKHATLVS